MKKISHEKFFLNFLKNQTFYGLFGISAHVKNEILVEADKLYIELDQNFKVVHQETIIWNRGNFTDVINNRMKKIDSKGRKKLYQTILNF